MSQRSKVIALYKHLQYLGREYPAGPEKFRNGCKKAFAKNSKENDPGEDFVIDQRSKIHSSNYFFNAKFSSDLNFLLTFA